MPDPALLALTAAALVVAAVTVADLLVPRRHLNADGHDSASAAAGPGDPDHHRAATPERDGWDAALAALLDQTRDGKDP